MHIVIIGAGLSGVTAAWYLAREGYRITVVERASAPAQETSFANGGQISISHPEPWSNPGAPMQIVRWLGRKDAPLLFRWPAEPARIFWGMAFLRECLPSRTHRNTVSIARLAAYSGEALKALRAETGIEYEQRSRGVLHLYFTPEALRHGEQQCRVLHELGIAARMLSAEEVLAQEPSLSAVSPKLLGGMLGEQDESGDAERFTAALAQRCRDLGVEFRFDTEVEAIEHANGEVTGLKLKTEASCLQADAYVLAAGSYSTPLARPLGERLPIYPVKGYSATFALKDIERAPQISLTDESRRIVCSRLGDRLRIAGTAELNGYKLDLDTERCAGLTRWAEEFFPGVCDTTEPNYWTGLRPTTPSNLPIIGRARIGRLYYNTGHGTLGWTLACGSARALAAIVASREPEVTYPFTQGQ